MLQNESPEVIRGAATEFSKSGECLCTFIMFFYYVETQNHVK